MSPYLRTVHTCLHTHWLVVVKKIVLRCAALQAFFFAISWPLLSQNLIPNPGFEDIFTAAEYQWVQPQGPYYHYEMADTNLGYTARSGRYINGLCMYPNEPNEYLHVKLLEPLKAGVQYRISVWARLSNYKNHLAEQQKYIGVHLGYKKLNTHIPGDFDYEPQVNLTLPEGNRLNWFYMEDTLTAKGGEQYITLGYFAKTQYEEYKSRKQDKFMESLERRYTESKAAQTDESKSWLYMSPAEQKQYLKKQKKKVKQRPAFESAPKPAAKPVNPGADFTIEDTWTQFRVRYYFDDFCLAQLGTPCIDNSPGEVLEAGRSITLRNVFFNTDQAELLEESFVQLKALLQLFNAYPALEVELRGYTDSRGGAAHNLDLSRRRAEAVVIWLSQNGVDPGRLKFKGFGASNPVAGNDTEAGRALNRRVEFFIIRI